MIQVVIIDDDLLVTTSLKTILEASNEIIVTGIGHSAAEAVALYDEKKPAILLTDIQMPGGTGLDAAKIILAKDPQAVILLLTTFDDETYIREALDLGVKGYLIKQNLSAIVPSLKAAYNGQAVFGAEIVTKLPTLLKTQESCLDKQFSEREKMILREIASGKNNKEIAQELFLSEGTVRNYISKLLEKLELRDRTQLAIYYYQQLH
jgi:DNA-binding NarL/FixJ family response regulator